jgi:hypothetical protein
MLAISTSQLECMVSIDPNENSEEGFDTSTEEANS